MTSPRLSASLPPATARGPQPSSCKRETPTPTPPHPAPRRCSPQPLPPRGASVSLEVGPRRAGSFERPAPLAIVWQRSRSRAEWCGQTPGPVSGGHLLCRPAVAVAQALARPEIAAGSAPTGPPPSRQPRKTRGRAPRRVCGVSLCPRVTGRARLPRRCRGCPGGEGCGGSLPPTSPTGAAGAGRVARLAENPRMYVGRRDRHPGRTRVRLALTHCPTMASDWLA